MDCGKQVFIDKIKGNFFIIGDDGITCIPIQFPLLGVGGGRSRRGPQGFQGAQGGGAGAQGPQGFQGEEGSQGTQGANGSQGVQGSQGSQGFQGDTGAQGSQGAIIIQDNMLIEHITLTQPQILALTDPAAQIVLPAPPPGFVNLISSITEYGNTAGFTNSGGDPGLKYYDSSKTQSGFQLWNDDPTNTGVSVLLANNAIISASPVQFNSQASSSGPFTEQVIENALVLGVNTPYDDNGSPTDTLDIYIAYRQIAKT